MHLTPTEYALLSALIADAGRVLTDRASCSGCGARVRLGGPLSARVHGPAAQELEPDPANPRYLRTEPGVGYRLLEPEADPPSG